MANFQQPASLNALQLFAQACSILRNTTRASNPAWYQSAIELNLQLHIRPDGPNTSAFYYDAKKAQWSQGPEFSDDIFHDSAKLEPIIAEMLRYARSNGASSLGVVLHVADEFATTELKPELDNPASLPDLRFAAVSDPGSILEDSSILATQGSWRVIPYPAVGSEVIGTTITMTRQYAPFLDILRQSGELANYPIIAHTLSAPLVAIMGLSQILKPTAEKPFVAILQYPWFTVLAFFNETADLRLIRTLQHRGVRRPTHFHSALATTNASLEFVDPDLFLLPLGQEVDTMMEANLRQTFTNCRIEVLRHPPTPGIPEWCPEPVITAMPVVNEPMVTSHTFAIFSEDQWALQDFLPTPKEIVEVYPSRSEMRLLRILRWARVATVIITLGCLAIFAKGIIDLVRRPEWAFDPNQANIIKGRLAKLNSERRKAEYWNNLLEDRSKAWTNMEALARLFPENSGILVKTYSYVAKPDTGAGLAKVGFVKEWKITGYESEDARAALESLNAEKITAHFEDIARITGNTAFISTAPPENEQAKTQEKKREKKVKLNRSIIMNIQTKENNAYKPIPLEETNLADDSAYPYTFELSITQRFLGGKPEDADPMSITVPKTP